MNVLWYNPSSQVNNCCDGGARLALTNEPSDQRRRTKRELLALVASVETEGFDSRIHDDDERTNDAVSGREGRRRRFALRTSLRILVATVVGVVVVVMLQCEVPIC